jgi:hypothetical protein
MKMASEKHWIGFLGGETHHLLMNNRPDDDPVGNRIETASRRSAIAIRRKRMNKAQREYSKAKELLLHCQAVSKIAEQEFIKSNNLPVKSILEIKNDKEFDRLNEKFYAENACIQDRVIQAREALKEKESDLIAYALSIVPVKLADQLRRSLHIIDFRQQIIDDIMQLDSKTVPNIDFSRRML